jgi:cell division protein FtsZ
MSETGMAMMGTGHASGEGRARLAAEMAVSSPLLEDINLAGAQGILVNVTAGMDLAIGELDEVGNTVKQYASDDATVVVGTVIEPDMQDEIRVTVVATGLGRVEVVRLATPQPVIARTEVRAGSTRPRPMSVTQPNYEELANRPAMTRKAVGDGLRRDYDDTEMLDIPSFLRRQAD